MYYNYFKRKKVNNSEFNARKGLVNPSSKYLFKPKFYILSSRSFSTVNSSLKTDVCTQNNTIALNLLPGWVTGFSDGECSFSVNIVKNSQYKTGWSIIPIFCIELHKRDLETLLRIQMFFGGIGRINHLKEKGHVVYSITSVKDLHNVIIPHFTKYPLLTIKRLTFILFKDIIELLVNKEHLNYNGLLKIMAIRTQINKGVSDELLSSFNQFSMQISGKPIVTIPKPLLDPLSLKHLTKDWLVGFTDA